MSRKLATHTWVSPKGLDLRFTSKVWQSVYFNSDKSLSNEQRDQLATNAYLNHLNTK